ncbi:class I SAM-dependent methyltransferase [Maribacter sp. HTCC2170]|uniref:class I SAM-dependent methyltransferase n=1 Tax=Maribacter sp. (strain HTCC2170 / KCCM 42371) TaxID=313603 RepID=UPI00006B497B|nr:class I SAM-dependent methyltransferase [Maribacter sp. HTCC2170]EAR00977.1 SAM-dependent methyltransferase [Maribacter sp. HTCC2170]
MTDKLSAIEEHYYRHDLYDDIINRLKNLNVDLNQVNRSDIAGVDEFHVRGAAISRELAQLANIKNSKVLDVGCGLGGPCRMLADEFNCTTTGIDLSEEFINAASKLSDLVGLSDSTQFIYGNANDLPFEDKTFDVVWTQHVQMNVDDKKKFYSEIARVLKNDGFFIYYDIFRKGKEKVKYPMPWAHESKISFLEPSSTMQSILEKLGMKKEHSNDQTQNGIVFFEKLISKLVAQGPPKLGLNVLMGENTIEKITNLLNGLKENKLTLQSGIYRK